MLPSLVPSFAKRIATVISVMAKSNLRKDLVVLRGFVYDMILDKITEDCLSFNFSIIVPGFCLDPVL